MSYKKKTLQELTIKDNFMFGAAMMDTENCRGLLEMVLGISIESITVDIEKSLVYNPEYKGVRLDVLAKDEACTRYNVEMQALPHKDIGKRSRYYHSQIDMELLLSGESYSNLPNTYVIFICDFDPFGAGKYRYTFENRCVETEEAKLNDGQKSIFLSTCGENEEDESDELVKFLKYVKADLEESTKDYGDGYVSRIQKSVQRIKESREMGVRYMAWYDVVMAERNEAKAEGKAEGKAEFIITLLESKVSVSEELRAKIVEQTDIDVLEQWFHNAIKATTIEEFIENM